MNDKNQKMTAEQFQKYSARIETGIEIFLDLDGVLSDFKGHAIAQNKFKEDGVSLKWSELDFQWWATMPVIDGAREFYKDLQKVGNVRVLTAPIIEIDCFAGKAQWMHDLFPEKGNYALLDLIICRAVDKKFFARPNHVLVDDTLKNVEDWIKAGGIGIHHKGDFADTMRRVKEAVESFDKPKPSTPEANSAPKLG